MVRAGADDAQILGILLNPEFKIYEHIRDQKDRGPVADARRQIERAREHVEKEETKAEQPAGGNGHDEELAKLARLSRLEYERCRKERRRSSASEPTPWTSSCPSCAPQLPRIEPAGQGRALEWPEPDPWPEPVNGADLLEEIAASFKRYVILPPAGDTAVSLWTLHTHVFEASPITPRLQVKSPEPRCGKTRVMEILETLSHKSQKVENITAAALFRTVEKARPTLILDEADTFISESEELRGILNRGHSHGGEVIRTVGEDFEPRQFSTWAPVAIAAIGKIPRTLEDRSIRIEMKRRARGEPVERWRADRAHLLLGDVHRKCVRWAQDHLDDLRQADPAVPDQLHDRAADNWRPLLAIADAAGGEWPERARKAAKTLSAAMTMPIRAARCCWRTSRRSLPSAKKEKWIPTDRDHRVVGRDGRAAMGHDPERGQADHGARAALAARALQGVLVTQPSKTCAAMPRRIRRCMGALFAPRPSCWGRRSVHPSKTQQRRGIQPGSHPSGPGCSGRMRISRKPARRLRSGRMDGSNTRRRRGRGDLAVSAVALLREAATAGVTVRLVEGKAKVEGKPDPEAARPPAREQGRDRRDPDRHQVPPVR